MSLSEQGILKKIGGLFYRDNKLNINAVLGASAMVITGGIITKLITKNLRGENRVKWKKFYYRKNVDTLRYLNNIFRIHLPLSIDSLMIIYHLRYLKYQKNKSFNYSNIRHGFKYGMFHWLFTSFFICPLLNNLIYTHIGKSGDSLSVAIYVFEKFVQSPAQKQLIREIDEINKNLDEKLAENLEYVPYIRDIIWSYAGSPYDPDVINYDEFTDIYDYVYKDLKTKFIAEEKAFKNKLSRIYFTRYLSDRAVDMFDIRKIRDYSFWYQWDLSKTKAYILFFQSIAALGVYFARLFGKMFISQIWYLILLELSGNHKLLDQYLFSLMCREPLYMVIAAPIFVLSYTRIRVDLLSEKLKNMIVISIKFLTKKVFGNKGFTENQ